MGFSASCHPLLYESHIRDLPEILSGGEIFPGELRRAVDAEPQLFLRIPCPRCGETRPKRVLYGLLRSDCSLPPDATRGGCLIQSETHCCPTCGCWWNPHVGFPSGPNRRPGLLRKLFGRLSRRPSSPAVTAGDKVEAEPASSRAFYLAVIAIWGVALYAA